MGLGSEEQPAQPVQLSRGEQTLIQGTEFGINLSPKHAGKTPNLIHITGPNFPNVNGIFSWNEEERMFTGRGGENVFYLNPNPSGPDKWVSLPNSLDGELPEVLFKGPTTRIRTRQGGPGSKTLNQIEFNVVYDKPGGTVQGISVAFLHTLKGPIQQTSS